jgi:LmbE family N-acetylglucosaminyl deacetylase
MSDRSGPLGSLTMQADLVVFGPHPDDIEIGLGGSVAKHVDLGYAVGLCDLTKGELGSNGTPEHRLKEAQAAADVLGVAWRRNLGWPDGEIGQSGVDSS